MTNKGVNTTVWLLLLYSLISITSHAQVINNPPFNAPTPTAADLGRYGDIPVSYYTGSPDITIPIHTMNVRGVEMPIRFEYDSRGVQLNRLPGWTGYNWTLSAGGVITRQVNGEADEFEYPTGLPGYPSNRRPTSYFKNHNKLDSDLLYINDLREHLVWNMFDYEPDMFYFNFMGHSGKFFLGNDGEWKVESAENFEVLFDITNEKSYKSPFIEDYPKRTANQRNQPKTICGFRLRDENGIVYEFGNLQKNTNVPENSYTYAIEYTTPFLSMGDNEDIASWIATSWYLTKVIDRFGNTLYELTYQRAPFCAQVFRNYCTTIKTESASNFFGGHYGGVSGSSNWQLPYSMQLDAPVYLTKIEGADGLAVNFYSEPNPKGLRQLYANATNEALSNDWYNQLKNRVSKTTDEHKEFYYLQDPQFSEYFADPQANPYDSLLERMGLMRLRTISINDYNNHFYRIKYDDNGRCFISNIRRSYKGYDEDSWDNEYKFDYFNKEYLPVSALTSDVDHWGYYNGRSYVTNNGNCDLTSLNQQLLNNRECDTLCVRYGSLSRITYPTGGVSVLEFESNRYSKYLNEGKTGFEQSGGYGAGLRIKSISEYEDTTCTRLLQRRTFEYTMPDNNTVSSGELYAKPRYLWQDWAATTYDSNAQVSVTTLQTQSIVPLTNSIGVPLGYSCVTENYNGGGKKRYRYFNLSDQSMMYQLSVTGSINTTAPSPYDKFTEHDSWRGRLLNETAFDSTGTLVKETTFNYRSRGEVENEHSHAANFQAAFSGESGSFTYYPGREYYLYHNRCDLISKKEKTLLDDGFMLDTTSLTYSNRSLQMSSPYNHETQLRVLKSVRQSRAGDSQEKEFTYPFECNDNRTTLTYQDFMVAPVGENVYVNGNIISSKETLYSEFDSVIITQTNHTYYPLLPKYEVINYPNTRDTVNTFNTYSKRGQILRSTPEGEYFIQYLWMRNDCWPVLIMQTPAAGTNAVEALLHQPPGSVSPDTWVNAFKAITANGGYCPRMIGYVYNGYGEVVATVSEGGTATYYDFDAKTRNLHKVYDDSKRLMFKFDYDYKTFKQSHYGL